MAAHTATGAHAPASPLPVPPDAPERDLFVIIRPNGWEWAEFIGTRAQLEAEGAIPAGTEWPEHTNRIAWRTGRLEFSLRRVRPPGIKGPMRVWTSGDWWRLRWEPAGARMDFAARDLKHKAAELADAIYRNSPRGRAEWEARWARYYATRQDERFQAFKSLVPGLALPLRRRQ